MRRWGLAGLLCLGASAFAQEKTLTITTPGFTVRNAVTRIAELTETDLKVAGDIDSCTIVLRLDDAPLDEALEKIASVTSGYWDVDGEKQTLRLDKDLEKRQQQEEREQRLERIKEEQANSLKGLGTTRIYNQGTWASALRIGEFMSQFDQTGRYVDRFIGDATLSKIGRSYIQNSARVLRLREMVSLEPQKRFRAPTSVRIDDEGRLYITDFASHRIQVYKKEAYPLGPDEIMPEPATPDLITV